jgi:Zn-dependent peptidase ImmA (M78 family)
VRSVTDFYGELLKKYDGTINFKRICADEGILAVKGILPDGLNGFYISDGDRKVIVLSETISYEERRDWAFHELWHALKSPGGTIKHSSKKEEVKANLFASLCRAPVVREGDTIESIREKYNCSRWIAKVRLEFELKKQLE